ncbi:MAG: sulfatase [Vicinamibacteria bacterium]|nr:sulfatase [Vicinamibacteria bacterium]
MRRCAILLLFFSCACETRAPQSDPPAVATTPRGSDINVLLVTIDALRADHLGMYGYARRTSPRMDEMARRGVVFENAYTYWPKTRGSFTAMMSGKPAARSGYTQRHRALHGFNVTLAGVLQKAGYATAAAVDNPNVGADLGFAKGFDEYLETWEDETLRSEMDRTRAITEKAVRFLGARPKNRPFFLWLHYVNPHAPYTPPPPYDEMFLDERSETGPRLRAVSGFFGGVHAPWAVAGRDRLGYYVAQYDGEIAAADAEVERILNALRDARLAERTLIVLTSDHGESLGEHDYYFDHGADLFDPCLRIPLVIVPPGGTTAKRIASLASTLDIFPTILDGAKVSFPPDLEGKSLLPLLRDRSISRGRLFAENDRGHKGAHDRRFKIVATPADDRGLKYALYDRAGDPEEENDVSRSQRAEYERSRRDLDRYLERSDREWRRIQPLVETQPTPSGPSDSACQKLLMLGYVDECPGPR